MLKEKRTGAIILAAGNSSRLGRPKQLLIWQGESMIRRTVNTVLKAGCEAVGVVYGAFKEEIETELNLLPVMPIFNPDWQEGMGNSLRLGLQTMASQEFDRILLLVCDQPFLSAAHLQELMETFHQQNYDAVASSYAETLGVPVLFSAQLLASIPLSTSTIGAKQILNQIPHERIGIIPFPYGEIDIDTEEDWENLQKRFPN